MKNAFDLLIAISSQIPEARNVRLELFEYRLAVHFNVGDRGSRYGLHEADFDRPPADLAAEIVAHHRSGARAPAPDIAC